MKKTLFVLVLVSAVGLLAYSNSFNAPFQFDDLRQIAENPMIKSLDNFAPALGGHALHAPAGSEYNNRRLTGYLTLALNYRFGGLDVTGYHILNLAIHLISGILVYFLIILTFKTPYFSDKRSALSCQPSTRDDTPPLSPLRLRGERGGGSLPAEDRAYGDSEIESQGAPASEPSALCALPHALPGSRSFIALFAALLFVAHPIQIQAVTYIVQRFTSMAAMFYLLSIVFYIKGRLSSRRAGKLASLCCSLIFAVLAMKTKEIAFTLPVVIVLYEFFFFKSTLKKKLLFLLPVLLTLVIIPISVMGTRKPLGELLSDLSARTRVQTNIPRWDYLMTQMRVIVTDIRLIFLPVNQNLDYDYPIFHSLTELPVILSSLFLLSLFGTAVYLFYRSRQAGKLASLQACKPTSRIPTNHDSPFTIHVSRLISFGILWFFITLSVESSVIPIADVIFEHRVYLPSVGAFMAISAAAFMIVERIRSGRQARKSVIYALPVLVIVLLTGATYARNAVWNNEVGLWQDVVRKSPGNCRAYNDLGYLYLEGGQTDKAIEYFRLALKIRPYYSNAHTNLGVAYYNRGWADAAIEQFKMALASEPYGPDVADDHHNLGLAYIQKGLTDAAISEFEAALKMQPNNYEIYNDLGVAYQQKGYLYQAIDSFRRAVALKPDYAGAHYNLGLACEAVGLKGEAEQHLREAHNLDPGRF
jgi:protein O-mannosyl-transferase